MSKRILLTGSTGFMGIHLTRELLDHGYEVTELVRPGSRHPKENKILGEFVNSRKRQRIEVRDFSSAAVASLLAGAKFDGLMHLAGLVSYLRADQSKMYATHVKLTQEMLSLARILKVPRFVHVSSIVAIGHLCDPSEPPLDERSPYNSEKLELAYWSTKYEAEQIALGATTPEFAVVVVNPGSMLGCGERTGQLRPFLKSLTSRPVVILPSGGSDFLDVRDGALGTIAAFERGRPGERYILGSENLSYVDLYRRLRGLYKARTAIPIVMPFWILKMAEIVLGVVEGILHIDLPINAAKLRRVNGVYMFNRSDKARAELGYNPRPIDNALRAMTEE